MVPGRAGMVGGYNVIGQEEDGAAAKRRRSDRNDGYGPDGWRGVGRMEAWGKLLVFEKKTQTELE